MMLSDTNEPSNTPIDDIEYLLHEGGRYLRAFLLPAIDDGLDHLPDAGIDLSDLFDSDEALLAERFGMTIPDVRLQKRRLLADLSRTVQRQTGLRLAATELARALAESDDSRRHDERTPLVVTPRYLADRIRALFDPTVYRVNWIARTAPGRHAAPTAMSTPPRGTVLKSRTAGDRATYLLVDAGRRLWLIARSPQLVGGLAEALVRWPANTHGRRLPMHAPQPANGLAWLEIGHIDPSGRFALTLGETTVALDDDAPLSLSCHPAAR